MTTYQKIAALIFRMVAVCIILYSATAGIGSVMLMGFRTVLLFAPFLVGGVALFVAAIPLARLTTAGFGE